MRICQKHTIAMSSNVKIALFVIISVLLVTFTFYGWQITQTPNFQQDKDKDFALLIPEGATYETVLDSLKKHDVVNDPMSFRFLAKLLNYPERVKPGRYLLKKDMGNLKAIQKLRHGQQDPVRLTFNNVRLKEDLIQRVGSRFAFGPQKLGELLRSDSVCQKYGFDTTTIVSMFLPNTYEIFWTTSPQKLLDRMHDEYQKFWTPARLEKAKAMNLTPVQVSTLASIVEEEQGPKRDERPRIAGMYINRLNTNMPLQADPTIKFALKDFGIKRILLNQLSVSSPYNTYRNTGLPPGPIRLAEINSLEAVLNYEKHNYTYMCAKEDFSGYHAFAENYEDHLINAMAYQNALNKRKIMK
jgi:UPF0755 protein